MPGLVLPQALLKAGTTRIKTSDLIGAALALVVAVCDGRKIVRDPMGFGFHTSEGGYWIWEEVPSGIGNGVLIHNSTYLKIGRQYSPDTNWAQGGPIIERERIALLPNRYGYSQWIGSTDDAQVPQQAGPTPLIAAMRCYIAFKLGEEVDIPEELL